MALQAPTQACFAPQAAAAKGPARPKRAGQPLALRPVARALHIALVEREVRERLSRTALDALLALAEVISEGQRAGHDSYLGSTMVTIDMAGMAAVLREPGDAGTAQRLAALLRADPTVKARVDALAGREVHRVTGTRPKAVRTEIQIRAQGARVFVDADVEASL